MKTPQERIRMVQLPTLPEQEKSLPIDSVTLTFAKDLNEEKTRIERERIETYLMSEARAPMVSLQVDKGGDGLLISSKYREGDLNENQKTIIEHVSLFTATGSANKPYAKILMEQTQKAFFFNNEKGCDGLKKEDFAEKWTNTENAITGAMTALNPKDEIEGMLCSRLITLHNHYMQAMATATRTAYSFNSEIDTADCFYNRATKLMRLYNETLEGLNKHRRKGEQKVVVQHQHVNVENGGQAIVGNVTRRGGDKGKN